MNKALINKIHVGIGIALLIFYVLFGIYTILNSGNDEDPVLGVSVSSEKIENLKLHNSNFSIHTNNLVFSNNNEKEVVVAFGQGVISSKSSFINIQFLDDTILLTPNSQVYIDTEAKRLITLTGSSVIDSCIAESSQECRWLVNQWKASSVNNEKLSSMKNFKQIAYLLWEDNLLRESYKDFFPKI